MWLTVPANTELLPAVFLLLISVERHTLLFPGCLRQGNPSTSNKYRSKSKIVTVFIKWIHFQRQYESERTARRMKRQWCTVRSFSMSFSTVSLCSSLWISSWRSTRTFSRLWVLHREEDVKTVKWSENWQKKKTQQVWQNSSYIKHVLLENIVNITSVATDKQHSRWIVSLFSLQHNAYNCIF